MSLPVNQGRKALVLYTTVMDIHQGPAKAGPYAFGMRTF
ncbi:hypothetical protein ANOBCDAF_04571 [Pleomorphomonas sp. T1.2MG-36]|nr:hypothetical protein ANOBCDAF_04571 [Pleomorphomonas sp. T1.2MG-36]